MHAGLSFGIGPLRVYSSGGRIRTKSVTGIESRGHMITISVTLMLLVGAFAIVALVDGSAMVAVSSVIAGLVVVFVQWTRWASKKS